MVGSVWEVERQVNATWMIARLEKKGMAKNAQTLFLTKPHPLDGCDGWSHRGTGTNVLVIVTVGNN